MKIKIEELEQIYELLSQNIHSITPEKRELFLIKLVLLSMYEIRDAELFMQLIKKARVFEN